MRSTPRTGQIQDYALIQSRVVGHRATNRTAPVEAKGEGHRGLAGRRIVGGCRRKGPVREMVVLIGRRGPVEGARGRALYVRSESMAR